MPDMEKVIKGLEQIVNDPFMKARADYWVLVCSEAIVMLKEQKELLKEKEDLGTELTNAVELIHKKNERIEKLLKDHGHSETFIVIDSKTGKEADTYNIALYEDWAKDLMYCDMEGWAIEDDGTLLLVDECGRFAYADRERFKVKWNE